MKSFSLICIMVVLSLVNSSDVHKPSKHQKKVMELAGKQALKNKSKSLRLMNKKQFVTTVPV